MAFRATAFQGRLRGCCAWADFPRLRGELGGSGTCSRAPGREGGAGRRRMHGFLGPRGSVTLLSRWAWEKVLGRRSWATKARVSRTVRLGSSWSCWRTWATDVLTSWGVLGCPLIQIWPDLILPPWPRPVITSSKEALPQPAKPPETAPRSQILRGPGREPLLPAHSPATLDCPCRGEWSLGKGHSTEPWMRQPRSWSSRPLPAANLSTLGVLEAY